MGGGSCPSLRSAVHAGEPAPMLRIKSRQRVRVANRAIVRRKPAESTAAQRRGAPGSRGFGSAHLSRGRLPAKSAFEGGEARRAIARSRGGRRRRPNSAAAGSYETPGASLDVSAHGPTARPLGPIGRSCGGRRPGRRPRQRRGATRIKLHADVGRDSPPKDLEAKLGSRRRYRASRAHSTPAGQIASAASGDGID
jgi:hypothetical protein